jgi:pimeloyl-ACP methyl ester carboxylesterase
MRRLQGILSLVHDTIDAITTLVEDTHKQTAKRTVRGIDALTPAGDAAAAIERVHDGVSGGVYDTIRLINRAVQQVNGQAMKLLAITADKVALDPSALGLSPELTAQVAPALDALEAGLNAAFGDFLAARSNGLAIELGFYAAGERLDMTAQALRHALPDPTGKVAVFVHGLGCTEAAFKLYAREHYDDPNTCYASLLQQDLGFTPLFLRYNTGRHISQNGRDFASLLAQLCEVYPVPIEQLVLVGHSMGGLVSRSAAHYGGLAGAPFVGPLSHTVCIGSPHLGAPLEKATNLLAGVLGAVPTAGTEVPAKLLNARSAGVKDLRFGYIVDEDWTDKDPDRVLRDGRHDVPMLDHVTYAFIAGSVARHEHDPVGKLVGDLLVRVPSGQGRSDEEARHIPFHAGEVLYGLHHLSLINHPAVYRVLKRLLTHTRLPLAEADLLRLGAGDDPTGEHN